VVIACIRYRGSRNEKSEINLGYSNLPCFQGNGYATEAASAMVELGLGQSGVRKVTATCSPENGASIRILQKAGLEQLREDGEKIYWSS
jgi:RimJ/RimL family protein N-acetyltransferase